MRVRLDPVRRLALVVAFAQELEQAGATTVREYARFQLHLDDTDVAELDRQMVDLIDRWVASDADRAGRPRHSGLYLLHRLDDEAPRRANASRP